MACSEQQTEPASADIDSDLSKTEKTALDTSLDNHTELYEEEFDSSQLTGELSQKLNPNVDDYPVDTLNPALIEWDVAHHDFGTLTEGESREFDFYFTNTGKSPLVIAEAYSSCGCTVPSFPVEPILPGERSHIHIKFNSQDKAGKVFKRIVVLANTFPEKANVVSISCDVNEKI